MLALADAVLEEDLFSLLNGRKEDLQRFWGMTLAMDQKAQKRRELIRWLEILLLMCRTKVAFALMITLVHKLSVT